MDEAKRQALRDLPSVDELVTRRWPVDSIREGFEAVMRGSGLKHAVGFEGR